MSLKKELISLLSDMADLMEFLGENPFKINAFRSGSNILRRIENDLENLIKNGSIKNIKGIGKGLLTVITEYYQNGSSSEYQDLLQKVPDGLHDLFHIRGLGAKKIKSLYSQLGISSLNELEEACNSGRISQIKGFAEKTQQNILDEIERIKSSKGFLHYNRALKIGNQVLSEVEEGNLTIKIEFTGELRRVREIISKIEFVALINDKSKFIPNFRKVFKSAEVENNKIIIPNFSQIPVLIYFTKSKSEYASLLLKTTGSDSFLKKIGLEKTDAKYSSEEEIFREFEIPYIIPEMREHEYFSLPKKLQKNSDLEISGMKGFLHFHTTYSDGLNTLTEMRDASRNFGFEYLAVCDHSKSAFYAGGLTEELIARQKEEIEKINKGNGIRIFQGIESDILAKGELDYPNDILKSFEFIVASVHSKFNLTEDEMTTRIIQAVENDYTDVLGHPTGRLLLSRTAYKLNIKKIIEACAANDVAIEINANPFRLDLDWRNIYYAREKNCKFAINTDAHSVDGIEDVEFGIKIARKGGIQKSEVINCFSEKEFVRFINRKTRRKIA